MMRATLFLSLLLAATASTAGQVAAPDAAELYRHNCYICHQAGGPGAVMLAKRLPKGVSPLLVERRDLQTAYVQVVARNGIGTMPRFTRIELSDTELARLAGWLAAGPDARR